VAFVTSGKSMLPTIFPGTPVMILPIVRSGVPRPGEIVAFIRNGRVVCHRVLFSISFGRRRLFYEKGDNNYLGRFITNVKILGKVVAIDGNEIIPPAPEHPAIVRLLIRRCTDGINRMIRR